MRLRSEKLLNLLTALVFTLNGLGILLIPERLGTILGGIPVLFLFTAGLALFILALVCESAIFIERKKRRKKNFQGISIIGLVILAFLYLKAGYLLEGSLPAALAILQLIFFQDKYPEEDDKDYFILGVSGFHLIGSFIVLLAWLSHQTGIPLKQYPSFLGVLLFGVVLLSGFTFFYPDKKISQYPVFILGLPWVVWGFFSFFTTQFPGTITSFSLVLTFILVDLFPWKRLTLPKDDLFGRNAMRTAAVAESLILLAVIALKSSTENIDLYYAQREQVPFIIGSHDITFLTMLIIRLVVLYGLTYIALTINTLSTQQSDNEPSEVAGREDSPLLGWSQWVSRALQPFSFPTQNLQMRTEIQREQISALGHQLKNERRKLYQLNLLSELSHQLDAQLDQPVAAQLTVNTLQRALECTEVGVFENEIERREFSVMAAIGNFLPPEYRQSTNAGLLGRALRLRKTQIINDTSKDPDFIHLKTSTALSGFAIPLIYHGHVKAVLEICDDKKHAFTSSDIQLAEKFSTELTRAWERSSYHQRLTELIQASTALSPSRETQEITTEIAALARNVLQARFIFVALMDQDGNFSRMAHSGNATKLLKSLNRNPINDVLIQAALQAHSAFRVRDLRKYSPASHIKLDHNGLRSMMAIPLRLHNWSVGAILAFGKQGELFFSENDESLAELISSQATNAIESAWLYQELRTSLRTTKQLYELSVGVIRAEKLHEAAARIAETARNVAGAATTGIVLFNKSNEVEAEVQVDESGSHSSKQHPMGLIKQALEAEETIQFSPDQDTGILCFPLLTPSRKYGALWLETANIRDYFSHHDSNMRTLANQAAVALERSILLVESQRQAKAIKEAYTELEAAYDRTLVALMSALDARDRETEGHSNRVSKIAYRLGEEMGLNGYDLKILQRGSLLHDIGKIGISDTILHKPDSLTEAEWKIMRTHPDIGAHIVDGIPFLQDTIPIIRYHQERWDGSGYPAGLSGQDIPLLARIFAISDAFDALISDRPYRKRIPVSEATAYLREQAGVMFDPKIVSVFLRLIKENKFGDLES